MRQLNWLASLFARCEPALSEASARDVAAIAALHAASFRRGWSEQEVEGLLLDRHVITHRALTGARLSGFIMSRLVEDAVWHAENGFAVTGSQAALTAEKHPELKDVANFASVFLPGGRPPREGETMKLATINAPTRWAKWTAMRASQWSGTT